MHVSFIRAGAVWFGPAPGRFGFGLEFRMSSRIDQDIKFRLGLQILFSSLQFLFGPKPIFTEPETNTKKNIIGAESKKELENIAAKIGTKGVKYLRADF